MSSPWSIIAQIGISALDQYTTDELTYDQARAQISNIDEMVENFRKQKDQLLGAYDLRKQITTDIYGNRVKSLYSQTGRSLFDINRRSDKTLSKTGLAYSGDVEEERGFASSGVKSDFEFSRKELIGKKGQELADIEMKKTEDITQIDNTISQLLGQKKVLDQTRGGLSEMFDPFNWFGKSTWSDVGDATSYSWNYLTGKE